MLFHSSILLSLGTPRDHDCKLYEGGCLIRHFLAYGHADQTFFRGQTNLYDGLTIPGTVAAFYQQGAGGFVLAQRKPYFIDPRTPVFQGKFDRKRIRKSHLALAEIHGAVVQEQVLRGPIDPTTLTDGQRRGMTEAMLQFQETFAQESTQKIDKYLKLIGQADAEGQFASPVWLVPPYFYDEDIRGTKYQVSLRIARLALELVDAERMHPVACVLRSALSSSDGVDNLIIDYTPFAQTILFPSKFDETEASQQELQGFWRLVKELSQRNRPPFMLYGGYFSILASHVGLEGLSHGIGYGESRDALSPRSGPAPERFYIPALHRFFPVAEAQVLLRQDRTNRGIFQCACVSCEAARAAGRGALDRRTRGEIFVHFLQVRHNEISDLLQYPLHDHVTGLRDIYGYATTIAPALADNLAYLERWANAIDTAEKE